jgi:hypothetical protein
MHTSAGPSQGALPSWNCAKTREGAKKVSAMREASGAGGMAAAGGASSAAAGSAMGVVRGVACGSEMNQR